MLRKFIVVCSVFLFSAITHTQGDPFLGTWTLNAAKSHVASGLFKDQTITYEPAPNGVKLTMTTVDAQGKTIKSGYTASFDGKDTPFANNPYGVETTALKRIDANTIEATWKTAGKVIIMNRRVVSKDGKSMTITTKGKTAEGKTVDDLSVFDKK